MRAARQKCRFPGANGGASSLGFAGSSENPVNICQGGAVPFDPQCNGNYTVSYPPGAFSMVEQNGTPDLVALDQPVLTLVASVITNPPIVLPPPRYFLALPPPEGAAPPAPALAFTAAHLAITVLYAACCCLQFSS